MGIFGIYLIKNLLMLFIGFIFPPFAYVIRKRWLVALGLLIIGFFFGARGYVFAQLLSLIAVLNQTITDYRYRDVLAENAQDDQFMLFLGRNFGFFNVERSTEDIEA